MPRVDFKLKDRVYILKLIATAQMTYSSFIAILYLYLILLDFWTTTEVESPGVNTLRWVVFAVTCLDFAIGTLLAFAANTIGIRCRRRIVTWIIIETLYIPISIFLLMQLYYKIMRTENKYPTYTHLLRINLAQVCFISCHYFFIGYAVDFLAQRKQRVKEYDPSIRPERVDAPTDPQITTTESRHIRMCQSLLFQPSTSKGVRQDEGSEFRNAMKLKTEQNNDADDDEDDDDEDSKNEYELQDNENGESQKQENGNVEKRFPE